MPAVFQDTRLLLTVVLTGAIGGGLVTRPSWADDPPGYSTLPFRKARRPAPESADSTLFQKIDPRENQVDFVIPIDLNHPEDRLYYSSMACGSVSSGDLDGDGRPDLFFACGAVPNRLYLQEAGEKSFRFTDVTERAGVADRKAWSTGAALADVDNDGDLDIYVCCYDSPNRLYLNESSPGNPRFTEQAAKFHLDLKDAGLMPSFADYDRDGDLDVFLAVNAYYRKGGRPKKGVPMRIENGRFVVVPPWDRYFRFSSIDPRTHQPKYDETGRPNHLLRNDGEKGFSDVSQHVGLLPAATHTNSAAWIDFDKDGWLDLYVGNDFSARDEFYHNNRDGTFSEAAADVFQHTTWFTMGSAVEDFNNDGRTDLVVADMLPTTRFRRKVTMGEMDSSFDSMLEAGLPLQKMANALFFNTGTGLFLESAIQSGIAGSNWTWTIKSGDLDGDGWIDLFFPNGHSRDFTDSDLSHVTPAMRVGKNYWDFYESYPELREKNLAYRNRDGFHFESVSAAWGLGEKTMSYGATLADFDRDGDLDLVVIHLNDPPSIFRNTAAERGARFLQVALRGAETNRFGIGTRLTLTLDDGQSLTRTLLPQNGYLESDEPVVNFGLGTEKVSWLTLDWPSGKRTRLRDLSAGFRYQVSEPERTQNIPPDKPESQALFRESGRLSVSGFEETPFDDFVRQPLLPYKLSQLGPGLAWGDADGDGIPDLYIGSPAGKPGRLLLQRGLDENGRLKFTMRLKSPFIEASRFEDMGALFFEADGDGDADLYVVSGGVECEPGADVLRDRLYLNRGQGEYCPAPAGSLPNTPRSSGSVVTAADFDRDGDLDLFVGGRVIPGQYPLAARSFLLINDGTGRFTDRTDQVSPHLRKPGLVTAALWSDSDNDGWIDLLLAEEWGSIRLFRNDHGQRLEDRSGTAGLSPYTGWWTSLAGADFDHDGDMDYVAGNFGLNTKYHPTDKTPELLYYGDLDGTGTPHLVEAELEKSGARFPRRGFSCSRTAMPFLKNKIKTFHNFASAELGKLYSNKRLGSAKEFEVTSSSTSLLENDGSGRFSLTALPYLAQIAPVFGIAATDFNSDGTSDLLLAQNSYSPQKETGPMDGGLSLLLIGNPDASGNQDRLIPLWPRESGIVVPGDGKAAGFADWNGDLRPDLLVAVNNGPVHLFVNTGAGAGKPLAVNLRTLSAGNPTGIGSRITLRVEGLPPQTAEVRAGSGYLTQNVATVFFGLGKVSGNAKASMEVRWPDGGKSLFRSPQDFRLDTAQTVQLSQGE